MDEGSKLLSVSLGIDKGLNSIGNSIALLAKAENQEVSGVNVIQQEMKTRIGEKQEQCIVKLGEVLAQNQHDSLLQLGELIAICLGK
ncbi:hypothetical protein HK096_006818 [Nowakowskiella sp. JEL0078]|nr:hypothetical protein HK096_006818 [Nowakowskiella sp. JEL0078]